MEAALKAFAENKSNSKTVILGDMLELGIYSKEEHENVLKLCLEYKFNNIFTIGNHFNTTSIEAKEIIKFERIEVFKKYLKKQNILFDFVLIKGSRALELEGLIPFLKSK